MSSLLREHRSARLVSVVAADASAESPLSPAATQRRLYYQSALFLAARDRQRIAARPEPVTGRVGTPGAPQTVQPGSGPRAVVDRIGARLRVGSQYRSRCAIGC